MAIKELQMQPTDPVARQRPPGGSSSGWTDPQARCVRCDGRCRRHRRSAGSCTPSVSGNHLEGCITRPPLTPHLRSRQWRRQSQRPSLLPPKPPRQAAVTVSVVEGIPAIELQRAVVDSDLLVVGSRGHGKVVGLLLGSVSQHVVSRARCPVVVVPDLAPPDEPA
jgi:Universal stress protein family